MTFGSVRELKRQVSDAGTGRVGSGWAWLVHDGAGLAVTSTPNQDSPLMCGATSLLGVDLWEHVYYLRYQDGMVIQAAVCDGVLNATADALRWDAHSCSTPPHRATPTCCQSRAAKGQTMNTTRELRTPHCERWSWAT